MDICIKKGDEVIFPSLTYVTTANAVSYARAKLVFADVNLNDWQTSIDSIKKNITKKTRAITMAYSQKLAVDDTVNFWKSNRQSIVCENFKYRPK